MNTFDLLRRLDQAADETISTDSRDEMLTRIMHTPTGQAEQKSVPQKRFRARRVVPALVALGLIAGGVVSVVGLPGGSRQEALGPALSFTTQGDVMKVRILDPEADSARYNKEFKAHHLDIQLVLIASSPSQVGNNPAQGYSGDAKAIATDFLPAGCVEAGTYPCVPEFTVPLDYKGSAQLYINRAAKPGEPYGSPGPLTGRGEPLGNLPYINQPVGKIVTALNQRGYTSITFMQIINEMETEVHNVPPNWYVVEPSFAQHDKTIRLEVSPTPQG